MRTIVMLAALALLIVPASAQETLVVDVNLNMLSVLVQDNQGRPVLGLGPDDFEILEDGEARAVSHFSVEPVPVAIGLAVDRSISIVPVRKQLDRAVMYLMESLAVDDQASLLMFSDRYQLNVNMTSNRREIIKSMQKGKIRYGTRFYDAIMDAAGYLSRSPILRKALIVISDGADHQSVHSLSDCIELVSAAGIPVYVIGYVGDDPATWREEDRLQIRDGFEKLARAAGGDVRYPKAPGESAAFAAEILSRLRSEYIFGFYARQPANDASTIEVRIRGNSNARTVVRPLPLRVSSSTQSTQH